MIEPTAVDADPPEAIGLAQAITNLESVREVVDNPTDLAQFGLADPQIIVDFKAEGGASGSFKLGNKNPTQSEIYAMKGGDNTRGPGVGVPGVELQQGAVRAARQADPEVRSREGRLAGAGEGRQQHRSWRAPAANGKS